MSTDPIAALAIDLNKEAKHKRRTKPRTVITSEEAAKADDDQDEGPERATAFDRMELVASEYELDVNQLVPTVRNFLVEQIKMRPKPWSACGEQEQRYTYAAAEHAATELVRKIVEAIAASGRSEPIRALLTKFSHGDKIVLTAELKTFSEDEAVKAIIALHKAQGKHVLISAASVDDYRGNLGPSIDPDQADLDFEAEDGEGDAAD